MNNFKSVSKHIVSGRGLVFVCKNPIISNDNVWIEDYSFLINSKVIIDNQKYTVLDIEFFGYSGKRRKAENIGILVENKE